MLGYQVLYTIYQAFHVILLVYYVILSQTTTVPAFQCSEVKITSENTVIIVIYNIYTINFNNN